MKGIWVWISGLGLVTTPAVIAVFFILLGAFAVMAPAEFFKSLRILALLWYLWVPPFLIWIFANVWLGYIRQNFLARQEYFLLELLTPAEITESPKAMELFLNTLYLKVGETSAIKRYLEGRVRPLWSLEIMSDQGNVHLYLRGFKEFQHIVETRFRAAYPEIELREVPDYTFQVKYDESTMLLHGWEYALVGPEAFPLKTYIEYETEKKAAGDERALDPLQSVLTFFGSLKEGNRLWLQIVFRAHIRRGTFLFEPKHDPLVEVAHMIVEKLLQAQSSRDEKLAGDPSKLTASEKRTLDAIQRTVAKPSFDCGMRILYFAPRPVFDPVVVQSMTKLFRPMSDPTLNSLKNTRFHAGYEYPWMDFGDFFKNRDRRRLFSLFRKRQYFYPPYAQKYMIFSTEELATLFHPLQNVHPEENEHPRIPRGVPPANLPR